VTFQTLWVEMSPARYPVYIGENIFNDPELLKPHIHGHQVMIVTQENIAALYLAPLQSVLQDYQCDVWYLPDGEVHKNITQWQKLLAALIERHERSTTVIALGGGVVSDLAGFAAACFQRGANYLQIPTTLIAQVDAAIGGKTAINHMRGKNLLGVFYQPQCVITDIQLLQSLPPRDYRAGLAEVIKYGLINDANFFCWLEENIEALKKRERQALLYAIAQSTRIKAAIVAVDERDNGLRRILNFGHTFGHALETATQYTALLHGEAVAIGMLMGIQLSLQTGWITQTDAQRMVALLSTAGFDLHVTLPPIPQFIELMRRDKKTFAGKLTLILLREPGSAFQTIMDEAPIVAMLQQYILAGEKLLPSRIEWEKDYS
jgi:3-dehydroquinate synthase